MNKIFGLTIFLFLNCLLCRTALSQSTEPETAPILTAERRILISGALENLYNIQIIDSLQSIILRMDSVDKIQERSKDDLTIELINMTKKYNATVVNLHIEMDRVKELRMWKRMLIIGVLGYAGGRIIINKLD